MWSLLLFRNGYIHFPMFLSSLCSYFVFFSQSLQVWFPYSHPSTSLSSVLPHCLLFSSWNSPITFQNHASVFVLCIYPFSSSYYQKMKHDSPKTNLSPLNTIPSRLRMDLYSHIPSLSRIIILLHLPASLLTLGISRPPLP